MTDQATPEHLKDLLSGLNEPQREAVMHGDGPLLILAGAGSGKTRVLTHRIAHLIGTGTARQSEILAITFTNKAAQEMRDRVGLLLGGSVRNMWVSTFHSACARILRGEAPRLGYTRQFTIYDQSDSRRLVKRSIDEAGVDPKRFTPGSVQHQISDAKNKLRDAKAYGDLVGGYFEQTIAEVYEIYERQLVANNAMDFDDLLFRMVNVLELFPEVRARYSAAFRHVLVDEYQDTNHAQYRLLQLIAAEHRNLAVVGDDDQSVYGFRGADIKNILNFQDDFPDAKVIKLEQNYRSTQTILDAANAVISHNRGRMGKMLWTDLGAGDKISVRGLDDEHAEARFVIGELGRMTDEGTSLSEIAVFYRTNAQSRVLEDALVRAEIPYQVIGGTRFYERAEIKDAIAYLQVLANGSDAISFARIVNSPRRGIGQTSLSRVLTHANTIGEPIWDVASEPEAVPGLGAAAIKALNRFMETMNGLRDRVADHVPVGDLVEAMIHEVGYVDALEAERTIESEGRLENLQQLVEFAREFDARTEQQEDRLDAFLQEVSLVADADTRRDDEGLVTLMTLHNAKGLEYPIVFVIGAEDGVFPHSRSIEEGSVEEERRLAYVAITRAMRNLTITFARRRNVFGSATSGVPSRFLAELPAEVLDRDQEPGFGSGLAGARPRAVSSWASARQDAPQVGFRMGEDVTHAAFGEGVVIGTEPGGVVVIRFASDGSERKLMAEFAPLTKH
ncbi:MAG TPA: UvrD-helicase domain-containing protein [Baekduia sp.]|nr:UvrD-helicase domain-containing protein [Baekduia sp.]